MHPNGRLLQPSSETWRWVFNGLPMVLQSMAAHFLSQFHFRRQTVALPPPCASNAGMKESIIAPRAREPSAPAIARLAYEARSSPLWRQRGQ